MEPTVRSICSTENYYHSFTQERLHYATVPKDIIVRFFNVAAVTADEGGGYQWLFHLKSDNHHPAITADIARLMMTKL
jgi:hypothetical protein